MSLLTVNSCPSSCSGDMYAGVPDISRRSSTGECGDAEVSDAYFAMLVEHDVRGFEIAMQHAAFVYGCESGAELARDLDRLCPAARVRCV